MGKNKKHSKKGEEAPPPPMPDIFPDPVQEVLPPPIVSKNNINNTNINGSPQGRMRDPERDILTRFKSQQVIRDPERDLLTRFRSQAVLNAPPPLLESRPGSDAGSLKGPRSPANSLRSSFGLQSLAMPLRNSDRAEIARLAEQRTEEDENQKKMHNNNNTMKKKNSSGVSDSDKEGEENAVHKNDNNHGPTNPSSAQTKETPAVESGCSCTIM